ncbi:MAG: RNA polymerase sigma factor [Planctomycetota bacterium]
MSNVAESEPGSPGTAELVQQAQAGDRAAFALLYREFARTVHGIVLATCGKDDADDLTQDVFVQAFQRLADVREPRAFAGWLCATARRAAIDRLRSHRRRPEPMPQDEPVGRERAPADAFAARAAADRALACIQRLPETYRETLTLRLVEGLTGPEIAARTGLTHGSVRVNLVRGMAMLRPLLQEAGLP